MGVTRHLDLEIYRIISRNRDGLSPATIAGQIHSDTFEVRRLLSSSPLLSEMCYSNAKGCYCPLISGVYPHFGMDHFAGFYSSVEVFLRTPENELLDQLEHRKTSRTLHSILRRFSRKSAQLARCSMLGMFTDLNMMKIPSKQIEDWEIAFYPEIAVSGGVVRCGCDVLLITNRYVFAFNFLPSARPSDSQLLKLYELSGDFGLIFGSDYRVMMATVMTKGSGQYVHRELNTGKSNTALSLPLCSRDMMYNILDDAMSFLKH